MDGGEGGHGHGKTLEDGIGIYQKEHQITEETSQACSAFHDSCYYVVMTKDVEAW